MAITCPDDEAHYDAISEAYTQMGIIPSLIGKNAIKNVVDKIVVVKSYVLISIGTYKQNESASIVSLGVMGHVFTFTEDDIIEELNRAF